jgi:hypothetical protein
MDLVTYGLSGILAIILCGVAIVILANLAE